MQNQSRPIFIRIIALAGFVLFSFALVNANAKPVNKADLIVDGLSSPWAMLFLPNGDLLLTERAGKIRKLKAGNNTLEKEEVNGVPPVYEAGQGGLLDIKLDRDFKNNQTLYISFAHGEARNNATRLISARLNGNSLEDIKVLFTGSVRSTPQHYAARIGQLQDNSLLLTVGDGFNYREDAQKLDSYLGKVIRVDQNGKAPSDNPFINTKGALPEIWSLGHRNQQGLIVVNSGVYGDIVVEHEHGPRGGDEVNALTAGDNYGWPVITQGIDYNGARISPFTEYEGMQQPGVDWTPSIGPSSMTLYTGALYPEWTGSLFVTSLVDSAIRRLSLNGRTVTDHGLVFTDLLSDLGSPRLRDIKTGPDGALYLLTDGTPAKVLRIAPE